MEIQRKSLFILITVATLFLSSCTPSPPKLVILTDTPGPSPSAQASVLPYVSPSGVYSELPGLATTEFPTAESTVPPADDTSVTPDDEDDTGDGGGNNDNMSPEQQKLWDLVNDPRSEGYSPLPVPKPVISGADMAAFNPDKLSDYLIDGLNDKLDGYNSIDSASLIDGKLYLTVDYDVYIDADAVYQYLKKTFSLSDKDILDLDIFSDCNIHKKHMYTQLSWAFTNDTENQDDVEALNDFGLDPNFIEIADFDLPQMPVANDAIITLVDYYSDDAPLGYQLTANKLSDLLSDKKSNIGNVLFKYLDGVITGIAEEYSE